LLARGLCPHLLIVMMRKGAMMFDGTVIRTFLIEMEKWQMSRLVSSPRVGGQIASSRAVSSPFYEDEDDEEEEDDDEDDDAQGGRADR